MKAIYEISEGVLHCRWCLIPGLTVFRLPALQPDGGVSLVRLVAPPLGGRYHGVCEILGSLGGFGLDWDDDSPFFYPLSGGIRRHCQRDDLRPGLGHGHHLDRCHVGRSSCLLVGPAIWTAVCPESVIEKEGAEPGEMGGKARAGDIVHQPFHPDHFL